MNIKKSFKTLQHFYTCVFLLIISFCFVFSIIGEVNHTQKVSMQWDGAKDYPRTLDKKTSSVSRIEKIEKNLERRITSKHPLYYSFVLSAKLSDKYLYKYDLTTSISKTMNDISTPEDIIDRNESGGLSFVVDNADYNYQINSISELKEKLDEKEIPFVLFVTPMKMDSIDETYQGVYLDYSEEIGKKLFGSLINEGISVINYTEILSSMDKKNNELFFLTDHHWLPQTGLRACDVLGTYLSKNGFDVDFEGFDLNNFQIEYSNVPMLGSQGRKATSVYVDYEMCPLLHPLYESDLTVFNSELNLITVGTIEETLYDYSKLEPGNPYTHYQYSFYGYGDLALLQIHNNNKIDGKRVLIIKESFADCMIPYLCNLAENVDAIDLRSFKGSLQEYISKNKPDIVVMIYGISSFVNSQAFEEGSSTDPFNFD